MSITVSQMNDIENMAIQRGFSSILMMENAGRSVATNIKKRFESNAKICVICGKGNNGGDGMAAARHLKLMGYDVDVFLLNKRDDIKSDDARTMLHFLDYIIKAKSLTDSDINLNDYDIIIDAIFGTGIKGKLDDYYKSIIESINSSHSFVVAVDVPSGMDPDTGRINIIAVKADITVTFHKIKRGLEKDLQFTGQIIIEEIGIPL